jgi:hypothetical protein
MRGLLCTVFVEKEYKNLHTRLNPNNRKYTTQSQGRTYNEAKTVPVLIKVAHNFNHLIYPNFIFHSYLSEMVLGSFSAVM